MDIVIGTWPIGPGQSVSVRWDVVSLEGARHRGETPANRSYNDAVNSYWTAQIGPFLGGSIVTYAAHGWSQDGAEQTGVFTVDVKPSLYIAWMWHQHQPLYRDPEVPSAAGSCRAPWVRLHALRDYYSVAGGTTWAVT